MKMNPFLPKSGTSSSKTPLSYTTTGEEDTFLWSLVDLLTLLLIFFIFLYAQSSGQLFSAPMTVQASDPERPAESTLGIASTKQPRFVDAVSIRPNVVPLPIRSNAFAESEVPAPLVSPTPALTPKKVPEKNESNDAVLSDLKQAALSAINETNDPSCSIRWNQNRLVFVLGERLTFRVGDAALLKDFKPTLKRIAALIASKTDYRVMVSGHTDDTPIATDKFPSNWELSAARAITVAKSIIENGVNPHRISVQGYGEYRPLYPNSTPGNKQANRRVEIALFKQQTTQTDPDVLY